MIFGRKKKTKQEDVTVSRVDARKAMAIYARDLARGPKAHLPSYQAVIGLAEALCALGQMEDDLMARFDAAVERLGMERETVITLLRMSPDKLKAKLDEIKDEHR